MAEDLLRYDIIVQDALRAAVKKILAEVARTGLPGEHHFYIAFDTNAPGVRISSRLKERYPTEMTIVLQHQFWDLAIGEHAFEVGLSFGGIPEKLLIPFSAIKGFFDPSVQFALEFEPGKTAEPIPDDLVEAVGELANLEAAAAKSLEDKNVKPATRKTAASAGKAEKAEKAAKADAAEEGSKDDKPAEGGEVVSLDAFRKKP
ncbi:Uncharacterized protein conserved in bacteria [Pannonibacter phragmitetus]|uniref:Uncharacterized protein conserved in bacteria n=1 Tax=Pannonibacter phragmitetus TaxID=121719 RepID=A0A378ZX61_9HYPH|nr:ClpXP protease specificity-enhancing factor SspB [Pannonibacter phragmitetus]SUB01824.1 Uncharacterized protein conserved in bacteria [Pannonibacter phragmitetus]